MFFREKTGVKGGDLFMSFKSIFQDVRSAVDYVHLQVNFGVLIFEKKGRGEFSVEFFFSI